MKPVIVFDVNETLLDVRALAPMFEEAFGDTAVLSQWFAQLLRTAYVVTLSDAYQDFGTCARHALAIVAQQHNITLSNDIRDKIGHGMLNLPPHPEVPASLVRLQEAGYRLATLTNSAPQALNAQLTNAGIIHLFEKTLSIDPTRRFKPHPATYQLAAAELDVSLGDILFVAAHNWDTSGAIRAGCRAAFVARPGMVLGPLDEQPHIIGHDMTDVVTQILNSE